MATQISVHRYSFAYRLGLVVRWCAVGCACSVLAAALLGLALR